MRLTRGLIVPILLILAACAPASKTSKPTPGLIYERRPAASGVREVILEPAWLLDTQELRLGLNWNSEINEEAVLVVSVVGAANYHETEGVRFNVDGEAINIAPVKKSDYGEVLFHPHPPLGPLYESRKHFKIDKRFIKRLIEAKSVHVHVELFNNFAQEHFSGDSTAQWHQLPLNEMAHHAFRNFYSTVWPNQSPRP